MTRSCEHKFETLENYGKITTFNFIDVKENNRSSTDFDGDIVLIERCSSANDGDIVVALVDDEEATLKRLRREIGKIILQPENSAYQPISLDPARVQIQGRLKTLYRRY